METAPVDRELAVAIESAEAAAWRDLYAAAPADWAAAAGVDTDWVGGTLVIRWASTGRRYFSRAIGFGMAEPATPAAIDRILDGFDRRGITMFLIKSMPDCRPDGYEQLLRERGLEPFDRQDRIIRNAHALPPADGSGDRRIAVERVTADTADEWADFLQRAYRLDTGPWLQRLIGRPGWSEYAAREDGAIVAARGMYAGPGGIAWLGMDGPVPGITTDDYEPDAWICRRIVQDGLAAGVRLFIADIEAPSDAIDTHAYGNFGALGFTRPYVRTHWTRP